MLPVHETEVIPKERLRHKRDVILGCIRQPGFEV
jgi:hypothetical protein